MRISIRACARRREASAGSPRNPSTSPTSHRWAGGLVRDATGVARLERGEVDAADNVRRLFWRFGGRRVRPKSILNLMILLTASAFPLCLPANRPAMGALLAFLLLAALGGCGGGAEQQPPPCHG